jgi:hypothetical protein
MRHLHIVMENPKFNKLVRAKKKSGKTWIDFFLGLIE